MVTRRRRLPHIDLPGHPQFITYRLHGSLPVSRVFPRELMTSGEAFVAMDRLLDVARSGPMFLRQPAVAEVVVASIRTGTRLGHYDLDAWVIMPNHVHLLLTPIVGLSKLLRALKGVTANRANSLLGRRGLPFWQDESFDHLVRSDDEFRRIRQYIEGNPVTAGLVARAEDYPWSSASR